MFAELPQREPQILHAVLDEVQAAHVAALLHVPRDGAHAAPGAGPRVFGSETRRSPLFGLSLQVKRQLVVELLLDLRAAEQRSETKANPDQPPGHRVSSGSVTPRSR